MSLAATAKSAAYIEQETHYGANNYHVLDVVCNRGQGVYLYDVDGNATWTSWPPTRR